MKRTAILYMATMLLLLPALWLLGCQLTQVVPDTTAPPDDTSSPQDESVDELPEPEATYETCRSGIDYYHPELYLEAGSQTNLTDQYFSEISSQIKSVSDDIKSIGVIFGWKQNYFTTYSAGGEYIGKVTVNQIMEEGALSGCHDHGLVLVSVLRRYNFPAVMVDSAGIQWAFDYSAGKQEGFRGHVFVEVYVEGKWILVNSTSGQYIEGYDPCNPVIPMTDSVESEGYFALFKGLDPEEYGIDSSTELNEYMEEFASNINSIEMQFPHYEIKSLL